MVIINTRHVFALGTPDAVVALRGDMTRHLKQRDGIQDLRVEDDASDNLYNRGRAAALRAVGREFLHVSFVNDEGVPLDLRPILTRHPAVEVAEVIWYSYDAGTGGVITFRHGVISDAYGTDCDRAYEAAWGEPERRSKGDEDED